MFRAPSLAGLPPFSFLLADLPASLPQVARHIGLSPATLARYSASDQAPRAVMLALFWESRWGRSASDCDASNAAAAQFQRAASLQRENAALRRHIAQLETLIADGAGHAANAPRFVVTSSF